MITVKHEPSCLADVAYIDSQTFHKKELMKGSEIDECRWWIARNESGRALAFGGAKLIDGGTSVMLKRAGVLEGSRGQRIQRKLIDRRVRWAGMRGATSVITYTVINNRASSNSLSGFGFKQWDPENPWVEGEVLYWRKDLKR